MISDLELSWAAGFFEGEGTVRINKPSRRNWGALVVSTVNTDQEAVDWFQSRWPGYMKPATGLGPRQKPAWAWVIAARQAAAFLESIRPFVVRARVLEKIDHGLAFQAQKRRGQFDEEYEEAQFNAYLWMRHLNKRGRS
jgi:hypothetical protein